MENLDAVQTDDEEGQKIGMNKEMGNMEYFNLYELTDSSVPKKKKDQEGWAFHPTAKCTKL